MRNLPAVTYLIVRLALVGPGVANAGGSVEAWGNRVILDPGQMAGIVKVANSGDFNLALRNDGTLFGWGHNEHGECDVPVAAGPFLDVAAGSHHGLAVTAFGSIVGWGRNNHGQATPPSPNSGFVAVAAGAEFSLGLKADGTIVGWGSSWTGAEFPPAPNAGWVQVSVFEETCVGRKADGSVRTWGSIPAVGPATNSGFVDVAAGYEFVVLLRDDGSVVHLGAGYGGVDTLPVPNSGFSAVDAGDMHALGLRDDGSIVAWGNTDYGQCAVPAPNSGFVGVAAGYFHSVGWRADGSCTGWGADSQGQAGGPAGSDAVEISWAEYVGAVRRVDGSLVIWGDIGPAPVPNEGFIQVATVPYGGLALRDDGTVVKFGAHWDGSGITPPMFSPNEHIVAIDTGHSHAIALRDDGSVLVMTTNSLLATLPGPNTGFTAVAAGMSMNLGLKEDGSIVAWGEDVFDQLEIPEPNEGFVDIAAGYGFGLGLKSDGTCVAWGSLLATPTAGNHDLVDVEAWGPYLAVGRHVDGSLEIWGDAAVHASSFAVPEPNSGFFAVSAGHHGISALRCAGASAVGPDLPAAAPLTLAASPNPFNPAVSLTVNSREPMPVSLEVLDLAGRRLVVLWRGELAAGGSYTATWNGRSGRGLELPSGTYLLAARSPRSATVTRKITLVR